MEEIIPELLNEIDVALNNGLYLVALTSALTLPDICGKAEYPDLGNKQRYVKWFNEYITETNCLKRYNCPKKCDCPKSFQCHDNADCPKSDLPDCPSLCGNIIYDLRCSLLHQGNPSIEYGEKWKIDHFDLIAMKNAADAGVIFQNGESVLRELRISIERLCLLLRGAVSHYYENNKEKFNFFNYSIIETYET